MTDPLTPPRQALLFRLKEQLLEAETQVPDGSQEGQKVVTAEAIAEILGAPLEPESLRAAEVSTPGRVVVWVSCPRCGKPATIALEVDGELRVDRNSATLHLKGKSKPASHVCGQTSMAGDPGQESFDLKDIVGDEAETDATTETDDAES